MKCQERRNVLPPHIDDTKCSYNPVMVPDVFFSGLCVHPQFLKCTFVKLLHKWFSVPEFLMPVYLINNTFLLYLFGNFQYAYGMVEVGLHSPYTHISSYYTNSTLSTCFGSTNRSILKDRTELCLLQCASTDTSCRVCN